MHGIEESVNESTDDLVLSVINKDLGINIRLDDIERSYRLGPINNWRNLRSNKTISRPIIIRFNSFRKRQEVFKRKRNLKGKQVSISENHTKRRYEIYKAAMNKYGLGKVWTNEGRIATKINGRYIIINSMDDLK